jgi:hypothetical protein
MNSIREVLHGNSSEVNYYNFDDRPSKIFNGIEHCRSTIVITEKGNGVQKVTTSKFQKWRSEERGKLLKNLKTTHWTIENQGELIPKIGTSIEKDVIKKMRNASKGKTVIEALKTIGGNVWYYNATANWIHAHMEQDVPKVEYYDSFTKDGSKIIPQGKKTEQISPHYKSITVDPKHQFIVNGFLNTSLFYWWFVIWSDGRDLLKQNITSFPIDLEGFPEHLAQKLQSLVIELMQSYEKNSHIQPNARKGGEYCIIIKEIKPKYSKSIIDQIDDIFAEYFGFTEKEKEFIKTFDMKFRIEEE